jgi:hypothetical protein
MLPEVRGSLPGSSFHSNVIGRRPRTGDRYM